MNILFLITARGGSKGVPRKNLQQLNGLSLVGFKALSAGKSEYCSRLIISTDCPQIQEEALRYGVEVPFTRPADLATDSASSNAVISHAMQWIETNSDEQYDAVMLLEPSSPFARSFDYDNAVRIMIENDADVVVGLRPVEVNSVFVGPLDEKGRMSNIVKQMHAMRTVRRQDVATEYTMNGALYLFKWDHFKQHKTFYHNHETTYGYVMEPEYSVEIDSLFDLNSARFLIENGQLDLSHWMHVGESQNGPGTGLIRKSA